MADNTNSTSALHSPHLRRFTKHLILASIRQQTREKRIERIGSEIDVDRIMGHQRSREAILDDISSFRSRVAGTAAVDKARLMQEKREMEQIDLMQQRVHSVEEKIDALSHIAFMHAKKNRDDIEKLKKIKKDSAVTKQGKGQKKAAVRKPQPVSVLTAEDRRKLDRIMNAKPAVKTTSFSRAKIVSTFSAKEAGTPAAAPAAKRIAVSATISSIEKRIKRVEKIHHGLQRKGHSGTKLAALKRMIDVHKKRLKSLKKKA